MMGNADETRPDLPIKWYLARDGQQHGPISDRELSELHQSGQLRSSDLLWRDGWSGWAPAAAVFRMPQLPQVPNEPSKVVGRWSTLTMAAGEALVHLLLLASRCRVVNLKCNAWFSPLFLYARIRRVANLARCYERNIVCPSLRCCTSTTLRSQLEQLQ
jgi:hypothetical protein